MLEVGWVAKAHGLRGEVVVALVSNRPDLRLVPGAQMETPRGPLVVVGSRPHQHRWIVQFEGVADRSAAEALRGTPLLGEPLEEEGALWVHELVGARVVDPQGQDHGRVVAVEAHPASDYLVLDRDRLVPLVFVVAHRPGEEVVVDGPPGLLD